MIAALPEYGRAAFVIAFERFFYGVFWKLVMKKNCLTSFDKYRVTRLP